MRKIATPNVKLKFYPSYTEIYVDRKLKCSISNKVIFDNPIIALIAYSGEDEDLRKMSSEAWFILESRRA